MRDGDIHRLHRIGICLLKGPYPDLSGRVPQAPGGRLLRPHAVLWTGKTALKSIAVGLAGGGGATLPARSTAISAAILVVAAEQLCLEMRSRLPVEG